MTVPRLWLCLDCWDIRTGDRHPGACPECLADQDRVVPRDASDRLRCYAVPAPGRTRYGRLRCTACGTGVSATVSQETGRIRLECECQLLEPDTGQPDSLPPAWERAPSRTVVLDDLTDPPGPGQAQDQEGEDDVDVETQRRSA